MLDLHKVYVFYVIAEAGSFSSASGRLYMSQSSVSQHVRELEAALGRQLFDRDWRGARLTEYGQLLYTYAQEIFTLAAQAETALTDIRRLEAGRIALGATTTPGIYLIPEWVKRFRTIYPALTVAVTSGEADELLIQLKSHHIEIAIVEGIPEGLEAGELASLILEQTRQMIVMGQHCPLWQREQVHLDDLLTQTFVMGRSGSPARRWIEARLQEFGVTAAVGAEYDTLEATRRALAAGPCIAILPEYAVRDEVGQSILRALPLEKPLQQPLCLIWSRHTPFSPGAKAFLEELSHVYSEVSTLLAMIPSLHNRPSSRTP